jgi:hypothetical protein
MIINVKNYRRRGRYLKEIFLRRTAARNRSYEKQETKESEEASEECTTSDRSGDSTATSTR